MPSADEILKSLNYITNHYTIVSIAWHLLIYFFVALLFVSKRKLSIRSTALFLSMLVFSVAIISILADSAFNAIIFVIIGSILTALSLRMPRKPISLNYSWFLKLAGITLMIAGTLYPHFSDNYPLLFLTAPMGLIPCPTLLLVVGFTLLFQGFSRPWVATLIVAALLYGFVGAFRLKVFIDVLLLFGVIMLLLPRGALQKPAPA